LTATAGLLMRQYRHDVIHGDGFGGLTIASLIETTGRAGALLIAGAFLLVVAVLLTGSRGGVLATGAGLAALAAVSLAPGRARAAASLPILLLALAVVAAALLAFGDVFVGTIADRGVGDTNRISVYALTMRSILDAPLTGFGYGTFADVFPLYRDRSVSVQGAWEQAHNMYLVVFQGLGLVFGSMLVVCLVLLALRCLRGAATRKENATVPRVAFAAACLVAVHSLVDFSLEIQSVALTFAAVLGAGVAQSESSRRTLED
jgi:O-antigen ligase